MNYLGTKGSLSQGKKFLITLYLQTLTNSSHEFLYLKQENN